MQKIVGTILLWFGVILSIFTFASRAGQMFWIFDVLSHYHMQYVVGLTIALIGLLLLRELRIHLLVMVAALALNLYFVVPFFAPVATSSAQAVSTSAPLRAIAMNISTSNAGYDKVVALVRDRQPDIVFMSEVREDLIAVLKQQLSDTYPYLHAEPSRFTLGIAFLSRHPFRTVETVTASSEGPMRRKYLRAELDWQGQPITIVGIHPLPPMNGSWAVSRDSELRMMGEVANAETQPFILLGDLNASPWSYPMQQLINQTELSYASQGYGLGFTWRLAGVLLGAPLDHILISPQWNVVGYSEEGDIGSDHVPIQADVVLGGR